MTHVYIVEVHPEYDPAEYVSTHASPGGAVKAAEIYLKTNDKTWAEKKVSDYFKEWEDMGEMGEMNSIVIAKVELLP